MQNITQLDTQHCITLWSDCSTKLS